MVVAFPAEQDGARIACAISWEALQDNYGCGTGDPVVCFQANRGAIQVKVSELIARGRFEGDGSILIRTADGA